MLLPSPAPCDSSSPGPCPHNLVRPSPTSERTCLPAVGALRSESPSLGYTLLPKVAEWPARPGRTGTGDPSEWTLHAGVRVRLGPPIHNRVKLIICAWMPVTYHRYVNLIYMYDADTGA